MCWFRGSGPSPTQGETFQQSWTYAPLGNVETVTYPICLPTPQAPQPRLLQRRPPHRHLGLQPGPAHPGHLQPLTLGRLPVQSESHLLEDRPQRVEDLYEEDPQGQTRPRRIRIQRGNVTYFDSGLYQFDEAGNIWAIGVDRYLYDPVGRLTSGRMLRFGPNVREDYTYDGQDNLLSLTRFTDPAPLQWNVDAKNRVRGPQGAPADIFCNPAGNLQRIGFTAILGLPVYEMGYDALNMQTRFTRRDFSTAAVAQDYRPSTAPAITASSSHPPLQGHRLWRRRPVGFRPGFRTRSQMASWPP